MGKRHYSIGDRKGGDSSPPFQDIAEEFKIDGDDLAACLKFASDIFNQMRDQVHPADKESLEGIIPKLSALHEKLSEPTVRERLSLVIENRDVASETDELEIYRKSYEARSRVNRAIENLNELIEIVSLGQRCTLDGGRRKDDTLVVVSAILTSFWVDELKLKATTSAHTSSKNFAKNSQFVRFVHQCMHAIGAKVDVQMCRNALIKLRGKTGTDLKGALRALRLEWKPEWDKAPLWPAPAKTENK
jgi:hypothetical protein